MDLIASHTLSLSLGYVSHWGVWEAARELLQNAIDQHVRNVDSAVVFEYDNDTERLTIGATNCHLEPRTLLLGETDKSCDRKTIGEFGEGYKLAMLVLTRLSYDVAVRNGGEVWRPSFRFDDEFQCHVFVVDRWQADTYVNGVLFEVGPSAVKIGNGPSGISEENFGKITENYLPDVPLDAILREDHLKGKVFVGGLFVCRFERLDYGYNFAPGRITLNRDRDMPSDWDIAYHASKLWQKSGDHDTVYESVAKNRMDTQYVNFSNNPDLTAVAAGRFAKEYNGAIPVTTREEEKELEEKGHRARIVPAALCDAIRSVETFEVLKKDTPRDRLMRFDDEHMPPLGASTNAAMEWASILEASKRWTGPAY